MRKVAVRKKKLRVGFKGIVTTVDEDSLSPEYCARAYNFAFENGALTGGIGIDRARSYSPAPWLARHDIDYLEETDKITEVFVYRRRTAEGAYDDRLVVHLHNGRFKYTGIFAQDGWHDIPALNMAEGVTAVNYNYQGEDILLLSSPEDHLYMLKDTTPSVCTQAPSFSSLCVYNERVFGSANQAKNQVWFSDDFSPSNWTVSEEGGGYIDFADECGDVIKVVTFLDYLYIFREHGIFRLTAYGEQSEFLLKKVFTNTGRIYKNTIAVCGDKIIFFADEGLFTFDGYTATRIAKELPPLILYKDMASGAYLNDCYYLACRLENDSFADTLPNDTVVKYDMKSAQLSYLHGYDIKWLVTVKVHNASDVLCVFGSDNRNKLGMISDSGKVMGTSTQKKYFSPPDIVSPYQKKTVRDVCVRTKYPITLRVLTDGIAREYQLDGSNLPQKVIVEKCASKVALELVCNSDKAHVSPIEVSVDVLNE